MDFKEALENGELIVYTDTDLELEREVKEYNKLMSEYRKKYHKKMKLVNEMEGAFFILNALVVVLSDPLTSLFTDLYAFILLIIFTAALIYFAVIKKNLIIPTAVFVLLIFLSGNVTVIAVTVIVAADIILAIWHTKLLSKLKTLEGYPHFTDITIRYSRDPENGYQI